MVEYLSGGRIQGSSTATATATFSDDFTSDNWTDTDDKIAVNTSNERLEFDARRDSSDDKTVYDLQTNLGSGTNASETAWLLRYELTWSTIGSGDTNYIFVGLSDSAVAHNSNADRITTQYRAKDSTHNTVYASDSDGGSLGGSTGDNNAQLNYSTGTTYYVTMRRTSATAYDISIKTGSHSGTEVVSLSGTVASTVDNLRYIIVQNLVSSGSATATGYIDNMEFYNNKTSTTTDEKTTLTNVPANTRFEDYTARKIYRRVLAPDPDFEDNFPSGSESSGWTIANGTNTTFSSGKMTNKNVRTTTNESVAKSLGVTTSSSAWLLRFKVKRIGSSGSQGRAFVEISNQNQATTSGSSSLSSLRIQLHDTNGVVLEQVHGGSGSGSASLTSTLSQDTDYWIEVIYTGTGATAQVFTNSTYSTPLSGTSTSTATGLTARTYQYFAVRNPDWSTDGDWKQYEFDDIELYNGISSAPSASWKERNTA